MAPPHHGAGDDPRHVSVHGARADRRAGADARTDIFAFGAVLYEMLTGRKAFEGKSQASLIGAILEREPPPVASLQPATPASLDHVVRTCLAKDPENRFHSAHDLLVQLKWIRDQGSQAAPAVAPVPRGRSRNRLLAAAFVTLLVATVTGFAVWRLKPEPSRPIRRFAIVLPGGDQFPGNSAVTSWRFRRTGRASHTSPMQRLYLRMMDQVDATPIPGTEEGGLPSRPEPVLLARWSMDWILAGWTTEESFRQRRRAGRVVRRRESLGRKLGSRRHNPLRSGTKRHISGLRQRRAGLGPRFY